MLKFSLMELAGTILSMLGCHMVEEIREVSIGMGFHIVRLASLLPKRFAFIEPIISLSIFSDSHRVCIDTGARYLFITRSIDKSRLLLETLEIINVLDTKCSLKRYLTVPMCMLI